MKLSFWAWLMTGDVFLPVIYRRMNTSSYGYLSVPVDPLGDKAFVEALEGKLTCFSIVNIKLGKFLRLKRAGDRKNRKTAMASPDFHPDQLESISCPWPSAPIPRRFQREPSCLPLRLPRKALRGLLRISPVLSRHNRLWTVCPG